MLSKKMSKIKPSLTLEITAKANQMKREGVDVISFGAGEPDFDTPDFIKQGAVQAIHQGETRYTPVAGTMDLKEAIVSSFERDYKLSYLPSQVVVSCGAKHSLYNLIQVLCDSGDEVIIPAPYWVSYDAMVHLAGATPVIVHTHQENDFKLTAKELDRAITSRTKVLLLNSPSNPTGMMYSQAEFEALAEVIERYDIRVISDEIYGLLTYGKEHFSMAQLSDSIRQKVIVVNGVSKAYAMTGWRIGYVVSDDSELIQAMSSLQSHSTSNPSSISQYAAVVALTGDQSCLSDMRGTFKERRDFMVEALGQISGIQTMTPDGAFYVFPNVKVVGLDGMDFALRLLEDEAVAVVPGVAFACPDHVRLSFATSLDQIKEGVGRIKRWVEKWG